MIPYVVCCCGDVCEGCGSVVVFAESSDAALALGRDLVEEPSAAVAHADLACSVLRPLWQGEPLRPSSLTADDARLWRLARWGDVYGWSCLECGLRAWEEVPESQPSRPEDAYPEFCLECDP